MDQVARYILERSRELNPMIVEWRRNFHMYPELAYQERRTAGIVAEKLREWGYIVQTGVAETGVVGLLKGRGEGKTIALRADMDALPLEELNDVPYKSRVKGVMHACGHDAHTAMLLGAARILSEIRDKLGGNVKLIFQPAEEGGNGAEKMVREGVLEDPKVDVIYGIHVWSMLESGKVGLREGPILAATGSIEIKVKGRGGHGAYPHTTIDPIVVGSTIVTGLQTIVSRNLDPLEPGVVSICTFQAGKAFNVIPEEALLRGTYRSLTKETLSLIKKRIEEVSRKACEMHGAECSIEVRDITPPTINEPGATRFARKVIGDAFGEQVFANIKPSMGGEDFAFYLERVPGAFIKLGTGNPEKKTNMPHHSPWFDVDEDVLYMGAAIHSLLAYNFLSG